MGVLDATSCGSFVVRESAARRAKFNGSTICTFCTLMKVYIQSSYIFTYDCVYVHNVVCTFMCGLLRII